MNIAKALKIKNRKARDFKTQVRGFFERYVKDNRCKTHLIATNELSAGLSNFRIDLNQLMEGAKDNASHKAKIAEANKDIWSEIFLMSEYKSLLGRVRDAYTGYPEGVRECIISSRRSEEATTAFDYTVFSKDKKVELERELISLIDELQDEIDTYNAVNKI